MTLAKAVRTLLFSVGALICMASSECGEEYSCSGACTHLARCEDEWLEDEGSKPMDDAAYDNYVAACIRHCTAVGTYDEQECVETETCERLRDGKCST